jgi:hypothetical protein
MMAKHGSKFVRDFTSTAYSQFGMRIVVLAAYVDGEGDNAMLLWVYKVLFMCISHNIKQLRLQSPERGDIFQGQASELEGI